MDMGLEQRLESSTEWLKGGRDMPKRISTGYRGVFYREVDRIGGKGKEKVFYVVYKKDGKVIEAKAGRQFADDMTPARANQYRTALIEGRSMTPSEKRESERAAKAAEESKWTISKLWDLYRETFSQNKVVHHEGRKFDNYLRKSFGDKEPGELLALDVDRLRITLQKQGKLTTAARILEILRRTINFGVKRGLVPPLPFRIEVPRLNNEVTEDLSDEQMRALLQALDADPDQRAANVMRMAIFTAMRRSEILGLKWDDVDFRRGFIRLITPKGGRDQTIPMNDSARAVLSGIEPQEGNPYVFPGRIAGAHLTECRKSFDRIRGTAGLPRSFRPLHGLRHAFASSLASSGEVDMFVIQRLLTHKSPMMTQRYSHLRDAALRQASDLAGDLVQRAAQPKKPGLVIVNNDG
jgi:integrase